MYGAAALWPGAFAGSWRLAGTADGIAGTGLGGHPVAALAFGCLRLPQPAGMDRVGSRSTYGFLAVTTDSLSLSSERSAVAQSPGPAPKAAVVSIPEGRVTRLPPRVLPLPVCFAPWCLGAVEGYVIEACNLEDHGVEARKRRSPEAGAAERRRRSAS